MLILSKRSDMLICHGLSHSEFRCKCDYKECRSTLITEHLKNSYKKFREEIDLPLKINSGYRCPRHNLEVGGSARSRHTSGEAIDISYATLKDSFTHDEVIDKLKSCGFTFVLWYADEEFFHCDVRPIYNN